MATGPEHYLEAERLIGMCVDSDGFPPSNHEPALDTYINLAQVHATLALAAATALGFETGVGPTWGFVARNPYPSGSDGA